MSNQNDRSRAWQRHAVMGTVVVAVGYFIFLSQGFSGFPSGDDYPAIFPIACQVAENGWASLRWEDLQAQHFSHRIVPVRLITLLQMALWGHVVLPVFQWIGAAAWAASFFLLWRAGGAALGAGAVLAGALVWFQPQAADNCLVPMQASNLMTIVFALTAFAWRARGGRGAVTGAWLLTGVCFYTTGNGLAALAVLAVWELAERRWRAAAAGSAWFLFLLLAYFRGFTNPEKQHYGFAPLEIAGNGLAMLGAVVKLGPAGVPAALGAGVGLVLLSVWAASRAWRQGDRFWLAAWGFVAGTVGLAAMSRVGWGMDFMMTERYRTYGLLLLLLVLLQAGLALRASRAGTGFLLGAAAGFAVVSWWHYGPLVPNARRAGWAQAASWERGYPGVFQCEARVRATAVEILEKARRLGVYRLPVTGLEPGIAREGETICPTVARWHVASRGYLVDGTDRVDGPDWVLFSSPEWTQVGFRPVQRIAIGNLLRGKPKPTVPVVVAGPPREINPEIQGTWQEIR